LESGALPLELLACVTMAKYCNPVFHILFAG
jgi:hypothetical protein